VTFPSFSLSILLHQVIALITSANKKLIAHQPQLATAYNKPSHPHRTAQRDTITVVGRYLPFPLHQPISQGHPKKLEFMSIENLKTYGTCKPSLIFSQP
jgi:hypothetical protein